MKNMPRYAVLTGDLVRSSSLIPSELEESRAQLIRGVESLRGWSKDLVVGQAEFFRGDSWQLLLADPSFALRTALFLRATMIMGNKTDTRIGIGIGSASSINPERISLSTGDAFEASGIALDAMSPKVKLTLRIASSSPSKPSLLSVVTELCDALIGECTARQSEILRWVLSPNRPTHKEIANQLTPPVTQQVVSRSLKSAHWNALQIAVLGFESSL
tara:strand:- start:3618 stop:4268 length:651 start_codon:yes stop_codon:yes gene_type:complete